MRSCLFLVLTLLCLAAAPGVSTSARARQQPVAVIVGAAMPFSDISMAELRSCFRGHRVEVADVALIPFNVPIGHELRATFDRLVLGLEPSEVGRFWVDARIRDQGKAPRTAPNEGLALRVASALHGAVTYVRAGSLPSSVKVLTVDGLAPGAKGYPLAE